MFLKVQWFLRGVKILFLFSNRFFGEIFVLFFFVVGWMYFLCFFKFVVFVLILVFCLEFFIGLVVLIFLVFIFVILLVLDFGVGFIFLVFLKIFLVFIDVKEFFIKEFGRILEFQELVWIVGKVFGFQNEQK